QAREAFAQPCRDRVRGGLRERRRKRARIRGNEEHERRRQVRRIEHRVPRLESLYGTANDERARGLELLLERGEQRAECRGLRLEAAPEERDRVRRGVAQARLAREEREPVERERS